MYQCRAILCIISYIFILASVWYTSTDVLKLLDKINEEARSLDYKTKFDHYIRRFMTMFLHNRIGTYLFKKEYENIDYISPRIYKKGELYVYDHNSEKKWIMFLELKTLNMSVSGSNTSLQLNKAIILTKKSPTDFNMIEDEIQTNELSLYIKTEKVDFITKPNEPKYTDEDLLETYNVQYV